MSQYGIGFLSITPMRSEAGHKHEQVSQLLYGELFEIIGTKKEWKKIKCLHDQYEGWILGSQCKEITTKQYQQLQKKSTHILYDSFCTVSKNDTHFNLLIGSILRDFDGLNYSFLQDKYLFQGNALLPDFDQNIKLLDKIVLKFLNAPYLWGGRTPFGIDCSGFTQLVYRFLGIELPRDSYQQAESGKLVAFVEEARKGDLAFFGDNKITHVGIVLDDRKIIHASGRVRIDAIDNFGIFNPETNAYSHSLKIIKRYF